MKLAKAVIVALTVAGTSCTSAAPFVAHDQASPVTRPGTPAGTIAVPPALKRLNELLAVVNSGDAAAMRKYLQSHSVDARTNQGSASMLLPIVLDLHRLSHGLDLVRVTTLGMQQIQPQYTGYTVGILRNRATGEEQALAIAVEPQAPHRIRGLPFLHPSLIATLVKPAPSAARSEEAQRKITRVLAPSQAGAMVSQAQQKPTASGTDWPQWRGPRRDGSVDAALPAQWPEALKKRWEIPVGAGHASPVVSGNRVVVIARESDQEIVRALDLASGKEIWRAAYPAPYDVNPAARTHGPGPKSTPAIAGGRVFTLGIGGILSAFDLATGRLLWRVPAPAGLPDYGTAMSPLVDPRDDTSVIAHVGGYENGALTSFDAATGKPRWQWTGDGPGYGSPIIATFGGVRQVIAQTQKLLVGLNASTGTLLWQMPFTTEFDQNAFTPLVFQDLLIVAGIDWPLTAIRLKLEGGKWIGEPAWTNPQTPMFMSSPVLIGETIYGLTMRGRGQFVAIDAASGRTLWNTQGREGENASMLGSRSWLLASTTDGTLVVARANPQKYEEVRRYQVAQSALWAHPAIAGSAIIVKDVDKVICWSF